MRKEVLDKAFSPLVANRDRRCQNQGRPVDSSNRFQSEYGLPGTRRSNDVKPLVLEVEIVAALADGLDTSASFLETPFPLGKFCFLPSEGLNP